MGPKITIDSATLANKGLELIEAHYLFGLDYGRIEVVVHPTSVVHALVRFRDGAAIEHLGYPDMRVPISFALTYRTGGIACRSLDFSKGCSSSAPGRERCRCSRSRKASAAAACVRRANGVAISAFSGRLRYGSPARARCP
jgi:1-deoxy-D-xylulose-5-phosphate reductoisomerase